MKVIIEKNSTGARWESDSRKSRTWTKTSLGRDHSADTLPVGTTVTNFAPFRGWNKEKFRIVYIGE